MRNNGKTSKTSNMEKWCRRRPFTQGFFDYALARGWSSEYETMNVRDQFTYEQGRRIAALIRADKRRWPDAHRARVNRMVQKCEIFHNAVAAESGLRTECAE